MTAGLPDNSLELRSTGDVARHGETLITDVPVPTPAANEVLVRVEASPINPSDLGVLIAGVDMATATVAGTPERPIVIVSLGDGALAGLAARIDKPLPVGNEGAGTLWQRASRRLRRLCWERRSESRAARCTRNTEWSTPALALFYRRKRRPKTARRRSSIP